MTEPVETAPSDMQTLGELMFGDDPSSMYQHLELIHKHLGETPDAQRRAEVLDYAREHLGDDALIDVELTVVEKALDGVVEGQAISGRADLERNGARVHEVLGTLSRLSGNRQKLEDGTYERSLSLLGRIQGLRPGTDYDVSTAIFGADIIEESGATPDVRHPRLSRMAGMAVYGVWTAIDRLDRKGRIDDWLTEGEREEAQKRLRIHTSDVVAVGARLIDRATVELETPEDVEDVFPDGVHHAFLGHAAYLRRIHGNDPSIQDQINKLVDGALEHVGPDTIDAVDTHLDLYHDRDKLGYSYRRLLLQRAVDITRESSREPIVDRQPRSVLSFLYKVIAVDSPFESRRQILRDDLVSNFTGYLKNQPDHIGRVFRLYDDGEPGDPDRGQGRLWVECARLVADHGFANGHYTSEGIRITSATLEQFKKIAPMNIQAYTRLLVKQRLETTTPEA